MKEITKIKHAANPHPFPIHLAMVTPGMMMQ
jgi:hypothetical protein